MKWKEMMDIWKEMMDIFADSKVMSSPCTKHYACICGSKFKIPRQKISIPKKDPLLEVEKEPQKQKQKQKRPTFAQRLKSPDYPYVSYYKFTLMTLLCYQFYVYFQYESETYFFMLRNISF